MHLVHQAAPAIRRDRLLRLPEVELATGLKKSTIYLLMKRGEFPRCVQVTSRCVAWSEAAVLQYVQDKITAGGQQPTLSPELALPGGTDAAK